MKRLYVLVGVAGSGKSTFANQHKNLLVLSSDEIRKEIFGNLKNQTRGDHKRVFSIMEDRLIKGLQGGTSIIYDATNLNRKKRVNVYNLAKRYDYTVETIVFLRPLNYLLEINQKRPEGKKVPVEVVTRMYKSLQVPRVGVDTDIITKFYGDNFDEFKHEFENDTPHNSTYHKETVKEHIEMTVRNAKLTGNNKLVEIARYHDLGKLITKVMHESGYASFKQHENVSAMYYLATENYNEDVLEAIFLHMIAHNGLSDKVKNRNKLSEDLVKLIEEFNGIDQISRITE